MAAGLMSCAKEISGPEQGNTPEESVPMTFNITVDETKAPKTGWADGDKIYVFFRGMMEKYLILEYNEGSGWSHSSGGAKLQPNDFRGLGTRTLIAVHFPVPVEVNYKSEWFSFTINDEPVYTYYLLDTDKAYTIYGGDTVSATISLGKPDGMVLFHVAGIQDNVSDYTFGGTNIIPVTCHSVGTNGAIYEDILSKGDRVGGFADSDGVVFAGRLVFPEAEKDYSFTLASNSKLYTLTRTAKTLTAGKMYNFPSPSVTGGVNWNVAAVNLGKISGDKPLYWATCNVGAATETDYGNYVAWGEISGYNEGKTVFDYNSYFFAGGVRDGVKTFHMYTARKYEYSSSGVADGETVLKLSHDAAQFALGDKFRMPTKGEFTTLCARTTKEWVDDYKGSGISGCKFTGNGNTIFFPAAGIRKDDSSLYNCGSCGYYWSSSLDTEDPSLAWAIQLDPDSRTVTSICRYWGCSIRPVSE